MGRYILKRLLLLVPTTLGILVLVFVLIRVVPGSPASVLAGSINEQGLSHHSGPADMQERFIRRHGLDRPLTQQLGQWLRGILQWPPDLGREFRTERDVFSEMWRRLHVTVPLNAAALFLSYLLAVPLGIFTALRNRHPSERSVTAAMFVLYSIPTFWAGSLLIVLFCNQGFLDIFPLLGLHGDDFDRLPFMSQVLDVAWHAVLPLTCLTYGSLAYIARQMRSAVLDNLTQDYVRTARAKGLSDRAVVMKHVLRNSLLPMLTIFGTMLPFLIGGSVIVETLFGIPGMGRYAWEGFLGRDYNIVMATTLVSAIITILGLLLSDLSYALVDPRIRYEG